MKTFSKIGYAVVLLALSGLSAPTMAARLVVTSFPAGAEVLVDGVTTGERTPMLTFVAEGEHEVTVRAPGDGWQEATKIVNVVRGKNEVSFTLTPSTVEGPPGPPGPPGPSGIGLRLVDANDLRIGGTLIEAFQSFASVFFDTEKGTLLLAIQNNRFFTAYTAYYLLSDCQGQPYANAADAEVISMFPFRAVVIESEMLGPDVTAPRPSDATILSRRLAGEACNNYARQISELVPLIVYYDLSAFQPPFRIEREFP